MVQSGFMGTSSGATRHLPQRGKAFLRVRFAYSSVGARLFCAFVLLTRPLGQGFWSKGIAHPADRNGVELRSSTEKSGSNAFRKVGSTGGKHAPRRSSGRAASRLFKISNLLQILKSSTPKTPARGVFSAQDDTRGALACPTESSFKGSENVKKGCLRTSSLFV